MTDPSSHSDPFDPQAEELYFAFREREARGEEADFDTLCDAHPAHASELRRMRSLERFASELARRTAQTMSVVDTLRARHGELIGSSPSLDGDPKSDSGPHSKLYEQLKAQGPRGTRYRLLGEVARGGMGAVLRIWDDELRRTLAMKVILGQGDAPSGVTPEVEPRTLGRFLEEAQITGQLDHPGIVPVHELGLDATGRVYFTMKLVRGEDLRSVFAKVETGEDGWSQVRALNVLLRVCEAMAFAHSKGVVHRDLKPANVMVGKFGEVYVMDWGLARVLGRVDRHDVRIKRRPVSSDSEIATERLEGREHTPDSPLVTMDGDVVGTPSYMPPEQARGELDKLGPHSDVYSIGAMLYELVTGEVPYVPSGQRVTQFAVLYRVLAGPPRPVHELAPRAPAELIAICEKAMARDFSQRYASTREVALDLRAYLEGRVVAAYETGTFAETRKWVQRNTPLAAAIAAVLLVAVVGAAAFRTQARRAEEAALLAQAEHGRANVEALAAKQSAELASQREGEARAHAADTQTVADFQTHMLSELSVDALGHTIVLQLEQDLAQSLARIGRSPAEIDSALQQLRGLLQSANPTNVAQRVLEAAIFEPAVRTVEDDYASRPLLAATLQVPLAQTLQRVGLFDLALRAARAAVASRRMALGEDHPGTLESVRQLAALHEARGEYADAEPLCRDTLARSRTLFGEQHVETASATSTLATVLQGKGEFEEAEPLLRESLSVMRAVLGSRDPRTLGEISNLAGLLREQGRLEEAESLFAEAAVGLRESAGNRHPDTMIAINNLAAILHDRGRLTDAEALYREALSGLRAVLGDFHPATLNSVNNFAVLLHDQGRIADAEALYREALAGSRATLGDRHFDTLMSLNSLGVLLLDQHKLDDAETLFREALEGSRATLGPTHTTTLNSMINLASLLQTRGVLEQAEPLFREALEAFLSSLGPDHPDTLRAMNNLGSVLLARGDSTGAAQQFRRALEHKRTALGNPHPSTLTSMHNLASALRELGDLEAAAALYREALAGRRAQLGDANEQTRATLLSLIEVYDQLHEHEPTRGHDAQATELRALVRD